MQPLAVRLSSHSSSFLEYAEWKAYNVKIQFAHIIIQDINITRTFVVEFLHKSRQCWHARKQIGPKATLINLVCIEESKEDEVEENHLMEA